jgi:hypothetical protein
MKSINRKEMLSLKRPLLSEKREHDRGGSGSDTVLIDAGKKSDDPEGLDRGIRCAEKETK